MSVSNQFIIQNFEYEPCSDKSPKEYYTKINLLALQHAMEDLGALNALKLWLYLSKNKSGYKHLELSSKDCVNNWGLGSSQFGKARDTLIEKGYLVPIRTDKKTTWYNFIQNPDSGLRDAELDDEELLAEIGKILDDEIPETGKSLQVSNPETGKLSHNEIPETGNLKQKRREYKVIENPETGKSSIDKIPETGNLNPETELISPEIIEERLQYYIDNIIIDNINEWEECRGYTLKYAIDNLNCQVVAEDDLWYYVITGNGSKVKFDKKSNKQYMDYANMF